MKEKRISFGQGKGSLTHNNRDFIANNVDVSRIADNITFVKQPIAEAYDFLFADATKRYNAKQKRNDRKIGSYYEHTFGCKPCNTVKVNSVGQKSFYEDVVQIGKMEDSGYGTEDFQLVAECLKEYMEGFQKRNPNFYVFNAVLHMDEATPHLHIDYIPVGHYKRGQDTQNGIAQALKEMGFGTGEFAIARWRVSEVEVLNKICREHGIEPLPPEKARGTLEIPEFKEQKQKADELAVQNAQAQAELDAAGKLIEIKTAELSSVEDKVRSAESTLADKKQEISDSEEKLSSVTAEVEKTDNKLLQEQDKVNSLMKYLPSIEKNQKAEHEYLVVVSELYDMMKSGMSILRNKDSIISRIEKLKSLCHDAQDKQDRADLAIYALRKRGDDFIAERDKAREEVQQLKSEKSAISSERQSLRTEVKQLNELITMLEKIAPSSLSRAKQLVEQEKAQRQREQEQQQYTQPTKKKKSWGLE